MGFDNDKSSTSESTNRLVDYDVYLDVIDSIKEKDEQIIPSKFSIRNSI